MSPRPPPPAPRIAGADGPFRAVIGLPQAAGAA